MAATLNILDANVLIDANRDYYPVERVPEFWAWLEHCGSRELIKIPVEVYEEVKDGKDDLATWLRRKSVREHLLLGDEAIPEIVDRVVREGYAADLTDDEVVKLGRDPFLVAYALAGEYCVVTTEVSRPSRKRANRHLPDVCRVLARIIHQPECRGGGILG